MLQVIISIMAVGSYFTGKYVAKKETIKEIKELKDLLLSLKKNNNELLVKNWKMEKLVALKSQEYWEAEKEFYKNY
jgi:hypothetical protein